MKDLQSLINERALAQLNKDFNKFWAFLDSSKFWKNPIIQGMHIRFDEKEAQLIPKVAAYAHSQLWVEVKKHFLPEYIEEESRKFIQEVKEVRQMATKAIVDSDDALDKAREAIEKTANFNAGTDNRRTPENQ